MDSFPIFGSVNGERRRHWREGKTIYKCALRLLRWSIACGENSRITDYYNIWENSHIMLRDLHVKPRREYTNKSCATATSSQQPDGCEIEIQYETGRFS